MLPGSLRRYGRTELSPTPAGEPGSGFGNVTAKLVVGELPHDGGDPGRGRNRYPDAVVIGVELDMPA